MTACTNNGGKARRVVTAALVGVLSVGAVPAIALATGNDVSLQSVQPAHTLVEADNGFGNDVEIVAGEAVTLDAGSGQYLRPTEISDSEDNSLDIDDYKVSYLDSKKATLQTALGKDVTSANAGDYFNNPKKVSTRTAAGTVYYLRIERGEDVLDIKFTYANPSVEGVYAYEGSDLEDTTFIYNGTNLDVNFADEDGKALPSSYDFVGYYKGDGTKVGDIKDAGSYTALFKDGEGKEISVAFTVSPLDLESASVTIKDGVQSSMNEPSEVIGALTVGGFKGNYGTNFKITDVKGPNDSTSLGAGSGEYTVTISASDRVAKYGNITNSATVTYTVLDKDVTSDCKLLYGASAVANGGSVVVSLPDSESFDASKVKVQYKGDTYSGDEIEVSFADRDGNKVDASTLSRPGDYTVFVRFVKQNDLKQWVGAYFTFTAEVKGAQVDADAGLTYTFDGKVVADNGTTPGVITSYTGSDLMDRIGIEVKDEDGKVYAEGTDYTVTIKKGSKTVDSIVDADTYTVTVNPVTFQSKDGNWTLTVKVDPMTPDAAKVDGGVTDKDGTTFVAYTGSDLDLDFTFSKGGKTVEIPAEAYDVTYYDKDGKRVSAPKAAGGYTATFKAAKGVVNYDFPSKLTASFTVTENGVFLDVPTNEWYSQAVYDAAKNGYMNGDGGKLTFSPMREITRAEAVCVLFNMAGGNKVYADATIPGYNPVANSYETGFTDVEGNEFFAKAVAWAKATGIVNGYADGTFGVSRKITSEEFACMLANYAEAKGEDVAGAEADLSKYADADQVSDWAAESVEWAVAKGVIGNDANLAPAGNILRMRVAVMVMNYQPEPVEGMVIDPDINKPNA